jgi:hypothetical protein
MKSPHVRAHAGYKGDLYGSSEAKNLQITEKTSQNPLEARYTRSRHLLPLRAAGHAAPGVPGMRVLQGKTGHHTGGNVNHTAHGRHDHTNSR